MKAAPPVAGRARAPAEIAAGCAAALLSLPIILANGAIAFAPLGPDAVAAGAAAAILTAGVSGVLLGAFASSRPLAGGNSSAISLSLSAMLAACVSAGLLPASAVGVGAATLLVAAVTLLAGLLLALAAQLHLARAATLVPYPVLSGFLNGTAALLVLTQLGPALGQGIAEWPTWGEVRPLAALVALATLAAMLLRLPPGPLGRHLRRAPPVLRGFALGWALDAALRLAGFGALLGPVIGAPPDLGVHAAAVADAWDARALLLLLPALAAPVLLTALAAASLQAIETLGTAAVLRERGGARADLDRDIGALAAANAATGLLGGMPATGSLSATRGCLDAGGQGRLSTISRGVLLLATLAALGPFVALIPQAVLAGVVLGGAFAIADAGTLRPVLEGRRLRRVSDPLVMLAVTGAALVWGLAPAVLLGLGLAALAFTASMAGSGVIRRAWRNPGGRSRTRRAPEAEAILLAQGSRIEVAELQGPLFFGSADAVAAHAERALAPNAKDGGADWLVLDLSRAARVDLSGGRQLVRLVLAPPRAAGAPPREAGKAGGGRVLLAGLAPGSAARADLEALGLWGDLPPGRVFPSLAAALEAVEEELLQAAHLGAPPDAGPRAAADALARLGLPPAAAAAVLARAEERHFPAGATILRQGDPPDALHVLLSGSAEIVLYREGHREGAERLRVATIAPGAIFGEMAVLTGAPRSADVVARAPCRSLALPAAALAVLEVQDAAAAGALLRAIARQIDSNLRLANTTIMTLES